MKVQDDISRIISIVKSGGITPCRGCVTWRILCSLVSSVVCFPSIAVHSTFIYLSTFIKELPRRRPTILPSLQFPALTPSTSASAMGRLRRQNSHFLFQYSVPLEASGRPTRIVYRSLSAPHRIRGIHPSITAVYKDTSIPRYVHSAFCALAF